MRIRGRNRPLMSLCACVSTTFMSDQSRRISLDGFVISPCLTAGVFAQDRVVNERE